MLRNLKVFYCLKNRTLDKRERKQAQKEENPVGSKIAFKLK